MNVLYMVATGTADPTRASIPFHLAVNGSAEVGDTAGLVLAGDGTDLIRSDAVAGMQGLGVPPMTELAGKATAKGIPVYV